MKIEFINGEHQLFSRVKKLGRKYASTLGFMPEGGFDDYARWKSIIIARVDDELIGYLMFRQVSRFSRITIVHLAVEEEHRGDGVSIALLDALRDRYKDSGAQGMVLNCRKDYLIASALWEKYGFVAKKTYRSRSLEEHYLTTWWYDFHPRDLFSQVYEDNKKVRALLDLNIIIKLRDLENGSRNMTAKEDPRCLLADWIVEETELCYAPEIFNEINRDADIDRMRETNDYVTRIFTQAVVDTEKMKLVARDLEMILRGGSDNTTSDRKEIASCVASGISYFLTFDEEVLKRRDEIENQYNIQIFTPQEFTLRIDELLHRDEYKPSLLRGVTVHTIAKPNAYNLQSSVDKFLFRGMNERKSAFENVVMGCVNCGGDLFLLNNQNGALAFYGLSDTTDTRKIHFLRIVEGALCSSILCQVVMDQVRMCVSLGYSQLVLSDTIMAQGNMGILQRLGFLQIEEGILAKPIRKDIISQQMLPDLLHEAGFEIQINSKDPDSLIRIEQIFFPLKIRDIEFDNYVIPIKEYWAGQLFDSSISEENLFGADPRKLWNFENVYYRHRRPITEKAPGRILWYVSGSKYSGSHSKAIVACSYLSEVYTGKGQDMFRQFKHYGIYEWRDIYNLCNGSDDNEIRVLKFSHTEVFTSPVSFSSVQGIMARHGYKRNTFNSPVKVNNEVFFDVYQKGMECE